MLAAFIIARPPPTRNCPCVRPSDKASSWQAILHQTSRCPAGIDCMQKHPHSKPERHSVPKPGLLIALLIIVIVAVFYGIRNSQNTDDSPDSPATLTRQGEARVPTTQTASWDEIDDPSKDGWDTEVFANEATKQLKSLGKLLADPDKIDDASVGKLIIDDFACEPLRPENLETIRDDQLLKIDRLRSAATDQHSNQLPLRGAGDLAEAMRAVAKPLSGATDVRFKAKVFNVTPTPGGITTRQYFSISGRTKSGTVEQHATWEIGWTTDTSDTPPRMQWLRVKEFEQTASQLTHGALFTDCTESVLGKNQSYQHQFLRGMNDWLERIQDNSPFAILGNPGLAVGDVNGDGLDDLYVCQEAGLPNRLFIQNPDGSAREESAAWGLDWLQSSRSALFVDLDNDSDQDLVVSILGGVVVAENDGKGHFRLRDVLATSEDTMSLSAVDYDLDGRLDIYVCAYHENGRFESDTSHALPGASAGFVVHDANNGGTNSLFHNRISNDGNWSFKDVTREVGLNTNNHRWSLAASWDDFDNDGDQDLYVANDYGRDHFYRNDLKSPATTPPSEVKPQFTDISTTARVEDSATGMSMTWGDYNRDGWMDAFVSNMWSSAGQRVTYQKKFQEGAYAEQKQRIQRLARGNTLLQNQGDGTFSDQSAPAGIEMGRWAWGSHFIDVNNDGWEDLIVSNGYITTEDTGDL